LDYINYFDINEGIDINDLIYKEDESFNSDIDNHSSVNEHNLDFYSILAKADKLSEKALKSFLTISCRNDSLSMDAAASIAAQAIERNSNISEVRTIPQWNNLSKHDACFHPDPKLLEHLPYTNSTGSEYPATNRVMFGEEALENSPEYDVTETSGKQMIKDYSLYFDVQQNKYSYKSAFQLLENLELDKIFFKRLAIGAKQKFGINLFSDKIKNKSYLNVSKNDYVISHSLSTERKIGTVGYICALTELTNSQKHNIPNDRIKAISIIAGNSLIRYLKGSSDETELPMNVFSTNRHDAEETLNNIHDLSKVIIEKLGLKEVMEDIALELKQKESNFKKVEWSRNYKKHELKVPPDFHFSNNVNTEEPNRISKKFKLGYQNPKYSVVPKHKISI